MHSRQIWVQKDKSSPQSPSGQSQRTVPWAPNRVLRPGPLGRSYGVGMALPECQDPIMLAPLCRWELECRQGAWYSLDVLLFLFGTRLIGKHFQVWSQVLAHTSPVTPCWWLSKMKQPTLKQLGRVYYLPCEGTILFSRVSSKPKVELCLYPSSTSAPCSIKI